MVTWLGRRPPAAIMAVTEEDASRCHAAGDTIDRRRPFFLREELQGLPFDHDVKWAGATRRVAHISGDESNLAAGAFASAFQQASHVLERWFRRLGDADRERR